MIYFNVPSKCSNAMNLLLKFSIEVNNVLNFTQLIKVLKDPLLTIWRWTHSLLCANIHLRRPPMQDMGGMSVVAKAPFEMEKEISKF